MGSTITLSSDPSTTSNPPQPPFPTPRQLLRHFRARSCRRRLWLILPRTICSNGNGDGGEEHFKQSGGALAERGAAVESAADYWCKSGSEYFAEEPLQHDVLSSTPNSAVYNKASMWTHVPLGRVGRHAHPRATTVGIADACTIRGGDQLNIRAQLADLLCHDPSGHGEASQLFQCALKQTPTRHCQAF